MIALKTNRGTIIVERSLIKLFLEVPAIKNRAPELVKTCSILAGIPVPLVDLATGMGHPHSWMPFQSILAGKYRQTPIFRHPFFRKLCFSLKYSLVSPPQIFGGMSKFGIYVIMKSS
jgi:hypothetical protein